MGIKQIYGLVFGLSLSVGVQAKVWQSENTWNEEWETQYSQWIRNSFNEDVFTSGKYAGISTDCADAVYAARVIFSAENKLPFVIGGANSETSKFDYIKSDVTRLKAFINYVGDVTSTQTLPNDTYPIAINPQSMQPGVIWLRMSIASENFLVRLFAGPSAPTGHTEVIKDISPAGAIYLMGSTVPGKVRNLLTSTSLVYYPANEKLGFRRWIWPQDRSRPKNELNNYSLEQFAMGLPDVSSARGKETDLPTSPGQKNVNDFTSQVQSRLAVRAETKDEYLNRLSQDICSMIHLRNEIVHDAGKYRAKNNKICMDESSYDNFSTPSRDKRIKDSIVLILDATSVGFFNTIENRVSKVSSFFEGCREVDLSNGEKLSAVEAITQFAKGAYSSSPNVSEKARWGLEPENSNCGK